MKKKLIVIWILIISLFGINKVEATVFYLDQEFTKYDAPNRMGSSEIKYGDKTFSTPDHKFDANDGTIKGLEGYCLDPNLLAPKNYKVTEIFLDGNDSEFSGAFEAAIVEILKNGYSKYRTSATLTVDGKTVTLSGQDLKLATDMALRSITLGTFDLGRDNKAIKSANITSAYVTMGSELAAKYNSLASKSLSYCSSDDYASSLACFKERNSNVYGWYRQDIRFESTGNNGADIMTGAESLYKLGIGAAADYKSGNYKFSGVNVQALNTIKNYDSNGIVTSEYKVINFTFKNFPSSGHVNNVQLTCNDCSAMGMSVGNLEYYDNGGWKNLTTTTDLSKVAKGSLLGGSKSVQIRFKVERNNPDLCVGDGAKYEIHYNEYNPDQEYTAAMVSNSDLINGISKTQRFVMIVKITDEFGSGNGPADKTFSGFIDCDGTGGGCSTTISTPVCSYDENDSVASITAPTNIKKCVLDNKDEAGNSYQLSTSNGGVDNAYCSIFCKEDYASIKFNPISQDIKCGGYFKLTASIEGKKDCYTSGKGTNKAIDTTAFTKKIDELEDESESVYKDYSYWTSVLNDINNGRFTPITEERCDGSRVTVGFTINGRVFGSSGKHPNRYNEYNISYDDTTGTHHEEKTSDKNKYDIRRDGKVYHYGQLIGTNGSLSTESKCEQDESDEITIDSIRSTVEEMISKSQAKMKEIETQINNEFSAINSCTDWSMSYMFAPKIKFAYQEEYYKLLREDQKYLQVVGGSTADNVSSTYCTGSINDEYECLSGSTNDANSVKTALNYTYYAADGAHNTSNNYSTAKYVKKTISKDQKYITPSVFYQVAVDGKITTNNGYHGNAIQMELLPNALPVAPNTVGGGWFKLMIEDLGEFYSTGGLGRLVDFESDRESSSVANSQALSSSTGFDGDYYCQYESPCRDKSCPNCDFLCVGDYCEFKTCPDCEIDCINCIFNLEELQLNIKTISTNNFNSVDRNIGYNWEVNTTIGSLSLIAQKAQETIKQIQENNETIYDDSNKSSSNAELAASFKLTPNVTKWLQEQNKIIDKEESGGYANNSLISYDYNGFTNIVSYSRILDEMIDKFGSDVYIKNRPSISERESNPNKNNYWTFWNGYVYNESVIGGPAWR